MPQRTNYFQRLVYLVQAQLPGARVYESHFLPNSATGELVEVDIVIEGSIAGTDIRIGIECTGRDDRKRGTEVKRIKKAGRPWIESMHAKHLLLPIDKTVLVSETGFARGVSKLAQQWKIELVDVSADSLTFTPAFRSLFLVRIDSKCVSAKILFDGVHCTDITHVAFTSPDGGRFTNTELALLVAQSAEVGEILQRWWYTNELRPKEFKVWVTLPLERFTAHTPTSRTPVQLVSVQISATAITGDIPVQQMNFKARTVTHAKLPRIFSALGEMGEGVLSMLSEDGALRSGATSSAPINGVPPVVTPMLTPRFDGILTLEDGSITGTRSERTIEE